MVKNPIERGEVEVPLSGLCWLSSDRVGLSVRKLCTCHLTFLLLFALPKEIVSNGVITISLDILLTIDWNRIEFGLRRSRWGLKLILFSRRSSDILHWLRKGTILLFNILIRKYNFVTEKPVNSLYLFKMNIFAPVHTAIRVSHDIWMDDECLVLYKLDMFHKECVE